MIMQKGPKGWVAKYNKQLIVTGKKDIGDAIAFVMKKAG